ncbi:hypothetical protein CYLTODRAFT_362373 [Cylindrobasidium torrendii FP15055 ss-10]|uniref:CxC2-like cysteine cluster KDZ transposase-associated domain-containing protein n=1 Tax=Cylindrobasidium torrendii FP15055 ss-10 TaxID=1314674 RepID=A0A0D7AUA9_9AGAR|nr:hypothetical protein CYLTODRAFT_362373 [Cylindrobasidium torrendii FP15055 ss-10]
MDGEASKPTNLDSKAALYVCEDCVQGAVCHDCLLEGHRTNPFHRVKKWTGNCLERWSLRQEGYVYSIGHPGGRCHLVCGSPPRRMTIIDINGYHDVDVEFCWCSLLSGNGRQENWEQLFAAGLWPASLANPDTAFRLQVLNNFITHNNTDKKSATSYAWSLRMLTNKEDPHSVSNAYKTFKNAARLLRWFDEHLWSGQYFGMDNYIGGRRKGSTTTYCPCCPEIDFNVSHDEVWKAKEEEQYALFPWR